MARLYPNARSTIIVGLPLVALTLTLPAAPLAAQEGLDTTGLDPVTGEIVVMAPRLPGQVDTDVPPLIELDEEDILAFGAGSVGELVAQLEPSSGSARGRGGGGRPVFLINGIRVASFREFFSYPPEAIRKVEVLPEEVAQRFGFPPDRRVINFLLQPDYASREIEVEFEGPDRGGYFVTEQEFTFLRIAESGRLNLNVEHQDTSLLTEAERDIIQTDDSIPDVATDPDPAAARSLVADSRQFEGTLNWATTDLDSGSSTSLSASFEHENRRALSGLDAAFLTAPDGSTALRTFNADDPLTRRINSDTVSLAGSYARPVGGWQFTSTLDASVDDTRTRIDQQADTSALEAAALAGALALDGSLPVLGESGFDEAKSRVYDVSGKVTLRGNPIFLPAGDVGVTFDLGYDWSRIESSDTRSLTNTQLTRGLTSGGINVAVPLTSRRDDFMAALGDFSANFQGRIDHFSDFGTLYEWSAGLTWEPVDRLTLSATYVDAEAAPTLSQLGDPLTTSFNVPIFDLTRGETALVTVTDGGNAALPSESQSDWKFSANWKLPTKADMRLNVDYIDNTSRNVTSGFPALTPALEAAFPDRVTRAADGRLLALDTRPLAYDETNARRVVIGLTMRGQIGERTERGGRPGGGPPGSGRPGSGRPAGGPPPGGAGNGPPSDAAAGQVPAERRAQFRATRERFCTTPEGEAPDLTGVPEPMLARLRGPDGEIDPARLAQARERLCSGDGPPGNSASGPPPQQASQGAPAARGDPSPAAFLGRGGPQRPRYFVNLSHTIELEDTILVAQGVPVLDQLDGDATATFGLARHSSRLEAGLFFGGAGLRVSGRYLGKANLSGSGLPGSSDLFIDDLATIDLRVFADLGRLLDKEDGPLKGLRLSFRADNVFDGRRIVRDQTGAIPLRFQPLLVDPTGRYVGIDIRKLF